MTEDKLAIHLQKHELNIDGLASPLFPGIPAFIFKQPQLSLLRMSKATTLCTLMVLLIVSLDQTPTPSTFLRDCENFGLFQDLGVKNPFDESFRKAVIDPEGVGISIIPSLLSKHEDNTN